MVDKTFNIKPADEIRMNYKVDDEMLSKTKDIDLKTNDLSDLYSFYSVSRSFDSQIRYYQHRSL